MELYLKTEARENSSTLKRKCMFLSKERDFPSEEEVLLMHIAALEHTADVRLQPVDRGLVLSGRAFLPPISAVQLANDRYYRSCWGRAISLPLCGWYSVL